MFLESISVIRVGESPSICPLQNNNGTWPRGGLISIIFQEWRISRGPSPIIFQEWTDTRTFSDLKHLNQNIMYFDRH